MRAPLGPALTTSVFWQSLLSQSRSNCLQPLPHRSWRGELRRILTSLYHCVGNRQTHTRTYTHTNFHSISLPSQALWCGRRSLGSLTPNVSSSINGCFGWLKGENTLKNHTSEQPLGSSKGQTDWHLLKSCKTRPPSNTEHTCSEWLYSLSSSLNYTAITTQERTKKCGAETRLKNKSIILLRYNQYFSFIHVLTQMTLRKHSFQGIEIVWV